MPRVWFTDSEERTYRKIDDTIYTYIPGQATNKAKRDLMDHIENPATPLPPDWEILSVDAEPRTPPPILVINTIKPKPKPEPRLRDVRSRIEYAPRGR